MKANIRKEVERVQEKMSSCIQNRIREFKEGDTVAVRDYRRQYRWIPGVITPKTGPISYKMSIAPGVVWRRHTDQIRSADFALQPDSQGTTLVTRPERVTSVTNTTKT